MSKFCSFNLVYPKIPQVSNFCRQCAELCVIVIRAFLKGRPSQRLHKSWKMWRKKPQAKVERAPSQIQMNPTRTKPSWHLNTGPRTHLRMCLIPCHPLLYVLLVLFLGRAEDSHRLLTLLAFYLSSTRIPGLWHHCWVTLCWGLNGSLCLLGKHSTN